VSGLEILKLGGLLSAGATLGALVMSGFYAVSADVELEERGRELAAAIAAVDEVRGARLTELHDLGRSRPIGDFLHELGEREARQRVALTRWMAAYMRARR
jgi:hypothetical protein